MTAANPTWFARMRHAPTDIVGVLAVVFLTNVAVFLPVLDGSFLRVVTGVLFVLFVPGYALVAALFPETGRPPTEGRTNADDRSGTDTRTWRRGRLGSPRGIDRWERVALSVALSLAIVPLLGLGVTLSPLSFTTASVFFTISAFTVGFSLVAVRRRLALHPQRRFRVSVVDWVARQRRSFSVADPRGELLLTLGLTVAIVFAVGTLGFAVLSPPDGETYTEFYVLSENESGDLVAAGYPDAFTSGEPRQLHTGIENYEEEPVDYEVVVQIQRVEQSEQGLVVTERGEVDRFSMALDHGESRVSERTLTVSEAWTGEDLRLKFLLYKGPVPETPNSDTAYRDLHIWIDVSEPSQNSTTAES